MRKVPWWVQRGLSNPSLCPDVRERISKSRKGSRPWWISKGASNPSKLPEVKAKLSALKVGQPPWNVGMHYSLPQARGRRASTKESIRRYWANPTSNERRQKQSERLKLSNPYRNRRGPTKAELKFSEFCERYQLPFRYTGNGAIWIGGLNPDFVSTEVERVAVEIFGEYWHSPLFIPSLDDKRTYDGRIEFFRKLGWKLVVIWENEVGNDSAVSKKLGLELERGLTC